MLGQHRLDQLKAGFTGHHHVDQGDRERPLRQTLTSFVGVGGQRALVPLAAEQAGQDRGQLVVVVDDQRRGSVAEDRRHLTRAEPQIVMGSVPRNPSGRWCAHDPFSLLTEGTSVRPTYSLARMAVDEHRPGLRGGWATFGIVASEPRPHTLNYLEDLGRALLTLGERDEADGQVWHLPAAEPLTGCQFLTLVYEAARHPARPGVATRPMIRLAGVFNPLVRELNETLYQFERPFISDASKFERALGTFVPTPHREAVRRTVDWFRSR